MDYDYVIIGGGPSGIFCADKLSQLGYKVCLIESLETLGGCHRVRYKDQIHTEHGPRVYLGSYLDFWEWIKDIGVSREENFKIYNFDMFSKDFIGFITLFKIHEILAIMIIYIIHCIFRIPISNYYTLEDFSDNFYFSQKGKDKLNRLARLIDGGNIDKSLTNAFVRGIDTGFAYNIYEPTSPLDNLLWEKFKNKLIKQKVDILLNTTVSRIDINTVNTETKSIKANNIILTIPPYAINKIDNAYKLIGYDDKFPKLSLYQQYEPYVCATIGFDTIGENKWGISDNHPWGLIAIDMGKYFKDVSGSLYIVSITHPDKIDPATGLSANDMDAQIFLEKIKDIVKLRFKINKEPIYKTLSPNVKKVNGGWIESDRAFLFSPPGWLKPDFNISKKNKVFTTGHHLGNSYHDYNSMESAIQNASQLLNEIIPEYDKPISRPWRASSMFWVIIFIIIVILSYKYRKNIIKNFNKLFN